MATLVAILAVAGVLQASAPGPQQGPAPLLIAGDHLGKLGAQVAVSGELLTRLFAPLEISQLRPLGIGGFDVPGRAWEIREGSSKERLAVVFADSRGENWSVNVTSRRVRTEDGIGVGSSVDQLMRTNVERCMKVFEEGGLVISCWNAGAPNLQFMFAPTAREIASLAGAEEVFDSGLVERGAERRISVIVFSRPGTAKVR